MKTQTKHFENKQGICEACVEIGRQEMLNECQKIIAKKDVEIFQLKGDIKQAKEVIERFATILMEFGFSDYNDINKRQEYIRKLIKELESGK